MTEFVAVAGYAAMVNLRWQIVMLPLEEFDHQRSFHLRQLGLLVHDISPAIKKLLIADNCMVARGFSQLVADLP